MPWHQSKPHIWRHFLVFVAISQIWQENFSKYVVWIGTKAYIWRSYYLTIWRILRKLYIRIYKYMPWYHSKPHIWRYFLVFVVISQIWHIEIRPNSHRLSVFKSYLTIWRVSRKSYIRIYRYMPWYHLQPHIWKYFLVFVAISQIWHLKIHPNSHRLAVLVLSYYLESFKKIVL